MAETQFEYQSPTEQPCEEMPTPDDYKEARRLALLTLKGRDLKTCCHRAGIDLQDISDKEQRTVIPYLDRTYPLHVSQGDIAFEPTDVSLSIPDQVLVLHYLLEATGAPRQNRWISFREVPSGAFYYPSFVKRAVTPLIKTLGQRPEVLELIARTWGRTETSPGDAALQVVALPRIPVVLSLWRADDEFQANGNIYFDASISSYLGTEDIAYLAGATVYRILRIAGDFL